MIVFAMAGELRKEEEMVVEAWMAEMVDKNRGAWGGGEEDRRKSFSNFIQGCVLALRNGR